MLLVRAAQCERVFTGSSEHQSVGELDAGFQRILLNEDHGAMRNRLGYRQDGKRNRIFFRE